MAIFKLDSDKFNQQLASLSEGGDKFQEAQKNFRSGVQIEAGPGGGEHWSGVDELDHFKTPLHASFVAIDDELKSTSERQHAIIANLRESLKSFQYIDDQERQSYMDQLDALDSKFEYIAPQGMQTIGQTFQQALLGAKLGNPQTTGSTQASGNTQEDGE